MSEDDHMIYVPEAPGEPFSEKEMNERLLQADTVVQIINVRVGSVHPAGKAAAKQFSDILEEWLAWQERNREQ